MYKPNGEEPMTKQEELNRRSAIADRKRDRHAETAAEDLHTAFYAALFKASSYRTDAVGATLEATR